MCAEIRQSECSLCGQPTGVLWGLKYLLHTPLDTAASLYKRAWTSQKSTRTGQPLHRCIWLRVKTTTAGSLDGVLYLEILHRRPDADVMQWSKIRFFRIISVLLLFWSCKSVELSTFPDSLPEKLVKRHDISLWCGWRASRLKFILPFPMKAPSQAWASRSVNCSCQQLLAKLLCVSVWVRSKKKPQKCVNRCKCLLWTQTDTLEQSWSEDRAAGGKHQASAIKGS